MTEVWFYHLQRRPLEAVLPVLLERCLERGWRGLVLAGSKERMDALNAHLWTYRDDSFLPHGLEGGSQDADQPMLLGQGDPVNGAKVLALVDGAEAEDAEITAMERVWVLFDGNDPARLQAAREQWKTMTAAGHAAQYWSEESGRWEKKSENPAR